MPKFGATALITLRNGFERRLLIGVRGDIQDNHPLQSASICQMRFGGTAVAHLSGHGAKQRHPSSFLCLRGDARALWGKGVARRRFARTEGTTAKIGSAKQGAAGATTPAA